MAASPIFIEANEEIPGVIERIRESPLDEVQLVLAPHSRFARSRFNFQLLKQYTTRLGKRVAIVAPDAAVQRMAEESGFPAQVVEPPPGAPRAPRPPLARAVPGVSLPGPPAETVGPAWTARSGRPIAAAGDTAAPGAPPVPATAFPPAGRLPGPARGAQPATPRIRVGVPGRLLPGRLGAGIHAPQLVLYVGALAILLAGMLAAAFYVPSAQVTLVADANPFASEVEINAEPNKPPIRIRSLQATSRPLSQNFRATGVKATQGQVARGRFTYSNDCGFPLQIANGQRLRGGSVQFAQLGDVLLPRNGDQTVDIVATQPGQAGNVGANQVTVIENNPYDTCLKGHNREPTSGGADEQKKTVIQDSDMQGARATLEQALVQQLTDDMRKQVKPGEKLSEPLHLSAPDLKTTHNVGDEIASFTATVTLKAEANFFMVEDVTRAFTDTLRKKVPANQQLTTNKVDVDYQVTPLGGGRLNFRGQANGFVAPSIDFENLKGRLAGKSPSAAKAEASKLPIRSIEIDQYPFPMPLMPLTGSRIDLRYEIDAQKGPRPNRG